MNEELMVTYNLGDGDEKVSLKQIADYYYVSYNILKDYYLQSGNISLALNHAISRENQKRRLVSYYKLLYLGKKCDNEKLEKIIDDILNDGKKRDDIIKKVDCFYEMEDNLYNRKYEAGIKQYYNDEINISSEDIKTLLINTNVNSFDNDDLHIYNKYEIKLFKLLLSLSNSEYNFNLDEAIKSFKLIGVSEEEALRIIKDSIINKKLTFTKDQYQSLLNVIDKGIPSAEFNRILYTDLLNKNYKKNLSLKTEKYAFSNEEMNEYSVKQEGYKLRLKK